MKMVVISYLLWRSWAWLYLLSLRIWTSLNIDLITSSVLVSSLSIWSQLFLASLGWRWSILLASSSIQASISSSLVSVCLASAWIFSASLWSFSSLSISWMIICSLSWQSIMSCDQDRSMLSGYKSRSKSKFMSLIWRSRSLKTANSFSFSLSLGGMSSWRNLFDSSKRRFISISVLGKLRSWRCKNSVKIFTHIQFKTNEKECNPKTESFCTFYPRYQMISHSYVHGKRERHDEPFNYSALAFWFHLSISRVISTCIIVMCSRIHMWREEASSLNCSNFLWASASNRGWPGGGSGKTS